MTDTTRRRFLRGAAGATLALGATGAASAQSTTPPEPDYGDWFDGVSNFEGTVDRRGEERVTVTVGASGNGGNFAFDPPAVRVSPGTTVVWEWAQGTHNVAASNGDFESELVGESGHTFDYAFEAEGLWTYVCQPHEQMGMKGAVVVGTPDPGSGALTASDWAVAGAGLGIGAGLLGLFARGAQKS